ncbi:hypothetical protein [Leifsonia sp. P73]|uniref:hypothetical protein n=1 Tax=Leifsonia sp. P73 TaxID=3423959 RepID=UPI003DA34F8E
MRHFVPAGTLVAAVLVVGLKRFAALRTATRTAAEAVVTLKSDDPGAEVALDELVVLLETDLDAE